MNCSTGWFDGKGSTGWFDGKDSFAEYSFAESWMRNLGCVMPMVVPMVVPLVLQEVGFTGAARVTARVSYSGNNDLMLFR
ncbi:hypothetical protein AB6D20_028090 (plasmid) [Vibrio splendidus]